MATSFSKEEDGLVELPGLVTLAWERENKEEGICMLWILDCVWLIASYPSRSGNSVISGYVLSADMIDHQVLRAMQA